MRHVVGRFIAVVLSNYLDRNIYMDTAKGYSATANTLRFTFRRWAHKFQRPAIHEIPKDQLTLLDLRRVTPKTFSQIGKNFSEEERKQVIEILESLDGIGKDISRARLSLLVQGVFTVSQFINFIDSTFSSKDYNQSWRSFYSFSASLGPLAGFGKELVLKLIKRNSETSKKAVRLAKIMGVENLIPSNEDTPRADVA